jgi:DNA-binding CsgD family transcriptional regulator
MELVERNDVLRQLADHLRAASFQGRLVLLAGEAGAGKTAVVNQLTARVRGQARTLLGRSDPLATPRPLGPVLDIAGTVRGRLLAAVNGAPGAGQVPECLMAELQADSELATLLVIEDAHWADEATLDLLHFLARRVERTRALVLVTYRDDALGRDHPFVVLLGDLAGQSGVHRIALPPLSQAGVAVLAGQRLTEVEELHRITGGNPFFVTEVLATSGTEIPATVRAAVLARRARLSASGQAAIDALAVIGSRATLDLALALLGPELVGLEECLDSGAVRMDGSRLSFRHELARSATWDAIPPSRRLLLHRAALNALRAHTVQPEDLDLLAEHAEYAQDPAAVLEYAPAAARRAATLRAHREAAAHYARALRFASTLPAARRAELLEARSYQCYLTSQLPHALTASSDALLLRRQIGDALGEAVDLRRNSRALWVLGRTADAWQAARAATALLEQQPPCVELGWAYSNLAQLAAYGQDADAALPWAARAIDLGEQYTDASLVLHARTNAALAQLLCHDQGWDDLLQATHIAVDTGAEEHAARGYATAAWIAVLHRDQPHAAPALHMGTAYCDQHDLDSFGWFLRSIQALDHLQHGNWDLAADDAAALLRRTGLVTTMHRLLALTVQGLLRARRGDPEAWPPLDEALHYAEPGDLLRLAPLYAARAEAAWLTGDLTQAQREAATGLAAITPQSDPWLTAGLARWSVRAGAPPPPVRATGPLQYELAGDWAGAAEAWDALGCPYDAALARLEDHPHAVERALKTFQQFGAVPAAHLATRRLRAAGIRPTRGAHAATRANPHGLTCREMQVYELLLQGLSDADIANRLVITRKTVSHHVAAILGKCAVHSRHHLPAADLGTVPMEDG